MKKIINKVNIATIYVNIGDRLLLFIIEELLSIIVVLLGKNKVLTTKR